MKKILSKFLIFRILLHSFRWVFFSKWRKSYSLFYPSLNWHDRYSCFLASYLYWVFKPIAMVLAKRNIIFSINNIHNAVGHIYPEVDYLLRLQKTQNQFKDKSIYYVYPKNPVLKGFVMIVGCKTDIKFILSGLLHFLIWPLLMRYPELTINAAHGPYNYFMDNSKRYLKVINPHHLKYVDVFRLRQKKYHELRAKTPEFYPLKFAISLSNDLIELIGEEKYVVIQIKTESVNGTWQPCDPKSYIETIKEILNLGYKVIFAGREKMPKYFEELGVINYSESKSATPENDYILVLNARAVIASASGFGYIPDVLDVPLLSINLIMLTAYPGRKTIHIPSLLSNDGVPMKFKEQLEYIYKRGQITKSDMYDKKIFCRDASDQDIFLAFKELYQYIEQGYITPPTKSQIEFKNHFPLELTSKHLATISDTFIKKHKNRY